MFEIFMTLTVVALVIVLIAALGWVSAPPAIRNASFIGLLAAVLAFIFGSDV